ncbi:MAG TPA: wax ester/triacylglycerol synthase domain-containing protein [Acidimicrobiales bacterium]|nr:wax ester/triacylglycerol synthase domain-containing protein [Acidimicrobiales bacterium]
MPNGAFPDVMTPADAVMWAIERDPVLRSTVTTVALLDRAPRFPALRRRLLDASTVIPRLRQRVARPGWTGGRFRWVEDPAFDIDYHLRRVSPTGPADLDGVLELARVSAMAGLDRDRPLWEFTVVEGLPGGGAAFVLKFHHCVTDGVGGIELAMRLLDGSRRSPTPAPDMPAANGDAAGAGPGLVPGAAGAVGHAALDGLRLARTAAAAVVRPAAGATALVDNARWTARLLAPVTEPLSPVMRGRSTVWRFDAFDVEMTDMKAAAAAAGGSVNDVFLTAVTAGLRRYHRSHGHDPDSLRMTLPISLRRPGDPPGGNRFTPVRFVVPLGTGHDPGAQARRIGSLVREWRDGRAPALTDRLAAVLCRLPDDALTDLFGRMLKNVDFVATNVPGLPVPMYLAGAELVRQYAFAPLTGAAVNVALLSHTRWACIGVNADAVAVPDHGLLTACLRDGFAEAVGVPHLRHPGAA